MKIVEVVLLYIRIQYLEQTLSSCFSHKLNCKELRKYGKKNGNVQGWREIIGQLELV